MSAAENQAVFLSYASQDAEAVSRVAEALRAAGVMVWFDQSELVGGDAWDRKIRDQIRTCALFVPVISAATQARREGYFRLEWKLAAQRTHTIADGTPFLLPVVTDATRDADALVPEEFRGVQWTRLARPEALPAFVARVKNLLMPAPGADVATGRGRHGERGEGVACPATPSTGRRLPAAAWIAAMAGLGVAVVAGALVWRRPAEPNAGPATRPPAAEKSSPAPTVSEKSIAVLPFKNQSPDPANAFFTDGVQEEILASLFNIRALHVISRTSVEQYRDTKKSIKQIGEELRVAYVLEGSVQRVGTKVRVTGQLIDARTDRPVWAKGYDKELNDIFAIQSEIAKTISGELQTVLSPQEIFLLARRPTENLAAYDQFLKAREVRRRFGGARSNAQAMEPFLLEALRLDPNYAAAYAELVYVYTAGGRVAEQLAKAQTAVDQAVRLAPDAPEVILARGDFYRGAGDATRAIEQYERFGRLRPGDPDYLARLAEAYQGQGKGMAQKTWELRKQLEDIDPGNLANLYRAVNLLTAGRRYADAIAVQRRIVTRLPESPEARHYVALLTFYLNGSTQPAENFWSEHKPDAWEQGTGYRRRWLRMQGKLDEAASFDRAYPVTGDGESITMAILHAARGDLAAARARLGDLPERLRHRTAAAGPTKSGVATWIQLGTIEGLLGNRTEALQCAKRVVELSSSPRAPSNAMARLYAWAGDPGSALAELGQLLVAGPTEIFEVNNAHVLRRDSNFFPLHGDPRFEALLKDPKNNAPLF